MRTRRTAIAVAATAVVLGPHTRRIARLLGAAGVLVAVVPQAWSQAASQAGAASETTVVVTGTRTLARIATDSPTPVDAIGATELAGTGQLQLQSALKITVPSFSVSAPSTAGALDFTSSPTLRGLGPGDLLLLVNGKRRHSTGALNQNNQIGRGDVGYDFNTIPTAAIGRIEVLRDGASAVYGADAVAGVINIVLDKSLGGMASLAAGVTGEGDGRTTEFNGGLGVPLGGKGVIRATLRLQERDRSNRAEIDTRQQYFGIAPDGSLRAISGNYGSGTRLTPPGGGAGIRLDPREATIDRNTFWLGDSPFSAATLFVNADKPVAGNVTLYAFGGFSRLSGDSQGFFRRPGDNNTVRAIYPDGFRPQQGATFENQSLALGVKGGKLWGFGWDLSTLVGRSLIDNDATNSNNPSMGTASPTSAFLGGTRFAQWTSNLDLTRDVELGMASPLRVAFGAELRRESFKQVAGEPDSYRNGGVRVLDGPGAGAFASVGMQPAAGLSPQDALDVSRRSWALYAEVEQEITPHWVLIAAARHENFSDFGSSSTYKLSSRLELAKPVALRGSISTGFKAPHLAQSFTSTTQVTVPAGVPFVIRTTPVSDPVARLLGATELRPAESDNVSLGLVFSQGGLAFTADMYQIEIRDRIVLSSQFQGTAITNLLAAQGFPGVQAVTYMTNAIDTRTRGVDLTSSYRFQLRDNSQLTMTAAANFNKTKIQRIAPLPAQLANLGVTTPLFDLTQQVRMTDASPKDKLVLGLNWKKNELAVNLNVVRYGEVSAVAFTNLTPAQIAVLTPGYNVRLAPTATPSANSQVIQTFGAKVLTDLSASYQIGRLTLTGGINNLMDVYPDRNIASTAASVAAGTNGSDVTGVFPYPYISPFGYTGRAFFAKAEYRF